MPVTLCAWNRQPDPGTQPVAIRATGALEKPVVYEVCPAHEPLLRAHVDRAHRERPLFLAAVGVTVTSAAASAFIESSLGLAIPLLLLGAALIRFPYATPMTVARNGVRGSVRALRVVGGILLSFGVLFAVLS